MRTIFETYLKTNTALPDSAIATIAQEAETHTLKRNELLLSAGQVCRHKTFIATGLLRTYATGTNGNEHILHFSPEMTWTLDAESYDKQVPTTVNIAAIEPTEVLFWKKADFIELVAAYPMLQDFSARLIQRTIHANRQRIATTLSATPEERYDDFVLRFPQLMQRLPLHMVASYLGISLKTLTRIRLAQLQR
jgi:CRP/FNR family transcriptional regulator, anaerobic regulatory protein